jgi:hypothetical protein
MIFKFNGFQDHEFKAISTGMFVKTTYCSYIMLLFFNNSIIT